MTSGDNFWGKGSALSQPLLVRHELVQFKVAAAQCHQLIVIALLHDLAVGENDDVVGVADGGETVGHHDIPNIKE